jgi:hypothetical protein
VAHPNVHELTLPAPLTPLARQLWFAVDPSIQFRIGPLHRTGPTERVVLERYWLLPTPSRARLLLPAANRRVTAGSADNYRRLRSPRERAARGALGTIGRLGSPIGLQLMHIETSAAAASAASTLPTSAIAAALGRSAVYAAVGIRTGANAKATLQLVDADGQPVGYAKLGWNPITDEYVRTEAAALSAVTDRDAAARAPGVLATFEYAGHPVVVTEPLPADVRSVEGRVTPPTSVELHALCPIVRHGSPASTGQLQALRRRLSNIEDPLASTPAGLALDLLASAAAVEVDLPVAARWHGDLTPWNCARDGNGVFWAWDWESSERDALAGLDALHWAYSVERQRGVDLAHITIDDCLGAASPHLVAAGVPRAHWRTLARVYVATTIERACSLALASNSWERVWISPAQLTSLAHQLSG